MAAAASASGTDRPIYRNFHVAFIGRKGSGKNSLAWRMSNLNDSDLPDLPSLPHREIVLETSTRPALRHDAKIGIQIRIVPPEKIREQSFFDKRGEISKCDAIVFIVDLGDEKSSDDFYLWYAEVKKSFKKGIPPFLIVGNKLDLRLFGIVTPHRWGESTAAMYSARAYMECSAKANDRVGEVLDTLLGILL